VLYLNVIHAEKAALITALMNAVKN